jgi:LacI family transcriptional regulator, repressor for deo operon, udp, cdd, tsx, nupC, and nupG
VPSRDFGSSPPSIVDVAQRAGVSVATVSRALRNHPYVAETTRARVIQAANELHYVADANASRLASGRSQTIGLLAPILTSWYTNEIIAGVEEILQESQLDLLISTRGLPDRQNKFALDSSFRQRVDGVITVDVFLGEAGAKTFFESGIPAVVLGEHVQAVPSLSVDNRLAAEIATRYLLDLGHTRIGVIGGPSDPGLDPSAWVPSQRIEGYFRALETQRLNRDRQLIVDGQFTIDGGRRAARQLLSLSRPPTAVFCMSDEMAFGVLQTARQMGFSVPTDLSVIGFDGHPVSETVELSTIHQPVREMGRFAAQLMTKILAGHEPVVGHYPQGVALIIRSSTCPPAR